MNFDDLSISRKLAAAFTGVVSITLIMSAAVFMAMSSIHAATAANDHSQSKLAAADDALSALVEQQNAVRGYVGSGDESFLPRVKGFGDSFEAAWEKLDSLTTDADERATLQDLKTEAADVMQQEDAQIAMRRDPAQVQAALASLPKLGRLTKARAFLKTITDPEHARVAARAVAQEQAFGSAMLTLAVGSGVAAAISIVMGWFLTRGIATPVRDMTLAMNRLAGGDHATEVPAVGRKDEVGQMAGAVQTFKDAAIEKVRLEAESEAQRRQAELERGKAEAERAETSQRQSLVVSSLATGLEKLSACVLTFRIETQFAPEYEKLRADFNAAMQELQNSMKVVAANTGEIRSGAGEITQASDDLSKRTEQQAASLEETAAALDEITATVNKTAEGAREARDAVAQAKGDAEHSGDVVRQAVAAMSQIEASSQQITQIIGVIDEIAFQTNLLALNAGVEAARAGDAGKGFAVVAQEVRALAQRSADAAKEIKALISASGAQVNQGVKLVADTGEALERIVTQVTQINAVVGEIAASAQEQATGLAQVNTAVNQMDQVTQQNAAMVEEATAASHALSRETQDLFQLISKFDLGEELVDPRARARPQSSAPPTDHAPATRKPAHAATARKPAPQMRATSQRQAEPDADWTEF